MATISRDGDNFEGGTGDDQVVILANDVVASGGRGNDWLSTAFFAEAPDYTTVSSELHGDTGRDRLHASLGLEGPDDSETPPVINAVLDGGKGDDILWLDFRSMSADQYGLLEGGDGNDVISISSDVLIQGETGVGRFISTDAYGGTGDDEITVDLRATGYARLTDDPGILSTVHGDDGADRISSTVSSGFDEASNKLYGGDGDDYIVGSATAGGDFGTSALNRALGGLGSDEIRLTASSTWSSASNEAFGDDGGDIIVATATSGTSLDLIANAFNDLDGGGGDDRITAKIELRGEAYDDAVVLNTVRGGDGDDRLSASITGNAPLSAHSELFGGEGDDRLSVKGGNDNILSGNQGDDVLLGSSGDDRMIGGQGDDYLRGRGGDDEFVFMGVRSGERDRIADMTIGEDRIDVSSIDANVFRSGNQAFQFGDREGTGRIWVEDNPESSGSIVYADNGRSILEIALLDGRSVHADDYSASDFIL